MVVRYWLDELWARIGTPSSRRMRPRARRHVRSQSESLEVRTLLSGVTFTSQTGAANPLDGKDVGLYSAPTIGDLDGDGDADVISGVLTGGFFYYQNTGTTTVPAFTQQTGSNNPLNAADVGDLSAPALGDLDGDGDLDLIVGNQQGAFSYFENTGSVNSPAFTARTGSANPLNGADVGLSATPALADLDGDGDLDLLSGERYGTFLYYRNTGTTSVPQFTLQAGANNPLNGQNVGSGVLFSAPALGDVDHDGDRDLIAGNDDGVFLFFENTGTAAAPNFVPRTGSENPLNGQDIGFTATPALRDLNGDGDLDLLAGKSTGQFSYFTGDYTPVGADLELTQTVNTTHPTPGGVVTFTVTLTNKGPLTATGIDVANVLPTGLTGMTVTPSAGSYAAGVWSVASLAAAGGANTATLTITGTVASSALGTNLVNSAEVTASGVIDPDSTPNNHLGTEDDQVQLSVHVNQAPVLTSAVMSMPGVISSPPANLGMRVVDLIASAGGNLITDGDPGAVEGIAVWYAPETLGTWQFSLNNGTTWQNVGAVSDGSARLLAADAVTRLRLLPKGGASGMTGFRFRAWDQTTGANGGLLADLPGGGSSAFSVGNLPVLIQVNVNSAPVLNPGGDPVLTAINEDVSSASNSGTLVSQLVASMNPGGGIQDPNPGASVGIAITEALTTHGQWQFRKTDSAPWTDMGTLTETRALLLAADATTRIRFVPVANFIGDEKITFVAWDQTSGSNGLIVNASPGLRGGSSSLSVNSDTATLTINSVNDAPVLHSATVSLGTLQNGASNPGMLISDLIASAGIDLITDVDASAVEGIALTYTVGSKGTWQYSLDNGTIWNTVGPVSESSARLLASDSQTRIRLLPNPGASGDDGIRFRAWDRSTGVNGGLAASTPNGGVTAFSAGNLPALLTVTLPPNHAPELNITGNPTLASIPENGVSNNGTSISALIASMSPGGGITDVDSGALTGVAIVAAEMSQGGTWQFSTNNGVTWSPLGAVSSSSARLLSSDAGNLIRFVPPADFHGTLNPAVSFRAWDRRSGANGALADTTNNGNATAFSVEIETAALTVTSQASTPSVTNATTDEGTQTTSGLVITRNVADGAEVSHFKITNIQNGVLYLHDGVTVVSAGSFITVAQGNAGLKFTPSAGLNNSNTAFFGFSVQASLSNADAGLGGSVVLGSISVTPAISNHAPTLNNLGSPYLTRIDQDHFSNGGTLVSIIISRMGPSGGITDVDAGAVFGVAITQTDNSNGSWEYSLNNGTTWLSVGAVSNSSARLLPSDSQTRVRFVPDTGYFGDITNGITFRAWDRVTGTNGGLGSTDSNGGSTSFSSDTETASITVREA